MYRRGLLHIILVFALVMTVFNFSLMAKEKEVALLLDGYQEGCYIIRDNERIDKLKRLTKLYEGDVVYKEAGVEQLEIKYYPNTTAEELSAQKLKIVSRYDKEEKSLLTRFLEILGFEKTKHQLTYATDPAYVLPQYKYILTRTIKETGHLNIVLPLEDSTFFSDSQIQFFAPDLAGKKIYLLTAKNKVIREIIARRNSYTLDLNQFKLLPGEKYYWSIGRTGKKKEFSILDTKDEVRLKRSLSKLHNQFSGIERGINQAIFFQSISAYYSEDINLNSLCYKMLADVILNNAEQLNQYQVHTIEYLLQEIFAD